MVVASLALSGCTHVGVTLIDPYMPKPRNSKLDIYTSEKEVKRSFVVVCLLDSRVASTRYDKRTTAVAIENAKPYARKYGADALIIISADMEGPTSYTKFGKGKAIIKAIRYTD